MRKTSRFSYGRRQRRTHRRHAKRQVDHSKLYFLIALGVISILIAMAGLAQYYGGV